MHYHRFRDLQRFPMTIMPDENHYYHCQSLPIQEEGGHRGGSGAEISGRVREQTRPLPELQPVGAETEIRAAQRGGEGESWS